MAFGGSNKRIAGITIEIGANTTKLTEALKQFDRQLSANKDNLRDIDKLLKLNPGNVTLLTQKQKELQSAIGQTKDRLSQLKSVTQDSVTPEEWDKLQREIIDTEGQLKSLEKEYKAFGSVATQQIKAAGEKMEAVGGKISAVGKTLTQKVTAPIVAGFGVALKTTADFDAQMSKVGAISGATGEDFDKLRAKALDMGETTKFTATESGQALEYMAMAGWKTEDMLDGIEGVMNLAAASGEDLGTTSDIVTDALTAFGNSAADAGDFADVLAVTSSNANTNVSLMGESFKFAAAMAGSMGYTYRDVGLALGLMANSGVKAGQAGRALQNVMKRIVQPTKQSGEALAYFNLSTIKADGSQKSLREIMQDLRVEAKKQPEALANAAEAARVLTQEYENGEISEDEYNEGLQGISNSANEFVANVGKLAGSQGLPGLLAILNASDEDFNDLAGAIDNSNGVAKHMSDVMNDNLSGQLKLLMSQLERLAISIGDVLTPYARKLVGVVQKVVDRFNKLSPRAKKVTVAIGAVAAAIGPVLVGVGGAVSLVGKAMKVIAPLAKFLPQMKAALAGVGAVLTSPVGIIAGVAALTVVVLKATGLWDKLKQAAIDAWPAVRQGAQDAWKAVQVGAELAWNAIKAKFGEVKAYLDEKLVAPLRALYESSVKPVFDKIAAAFEPVKQSAAATWDVIKGIGKGWNSFGDLKILLGDLWQRLKEFGAKLGTIITEIDWKGVGKTAWDLLMSGFEVAGDWIQKLVLGDEYTPDSTWGDVGGKLWGLVQTGFNAVGDWIKGLVLGDNYTPDSTWADVGGKLWGGIVSGMSAAVDWLSGLFADWSGKLSSGAIDFAAVGSAIWTGITSAFSGAVEWFTNLFGGTGDTDTSSVKGSIASVDWAGLGASMLSLIGSAFTGVGEIFKGFFVTAWNAVNKLNWAGLGRNMWNAIKAAFKSAATWLKDKFIEAFNKITNLNWAGLGRNILRGIKDGLAALRDWFIGLFDLSNVHIPLPHLSWSHTYDISDPFNLPTPQIEWYRKAYDNPVVFTRPTVVNTPYGPKGFGDGNGGEVVLSEAKLRQLTGGRGTVNNNITINQLPGESSEQLAQRVQRVLVQWDRQQRAVYSR